MWHKVTERLPEQAGFYRTRRKLPNGIVEEDVSEFAFGSFDGRPYWANARGRVISSVIEWREEDQRADESAAGGVL